MEFFDIYIVGIVSLVSVRKLKCPCSAWLETWIAWLGFEPVGTSVLGENKYVEFVRCNSEQDDVYNKLLRPVVH